jgi:uncharacterized membrane-anchored protein
MERDASAHPPDHPLRVELNDELHARPAESLAAPLDVTFLALATAGVDRGREWQHLVDLLHRYGRAPEGPAAAHLSIDLGPFRLRYERHAEFSRYKFIVAGDDAPFGTRAIDVVPQDWIAAIQGQRLVATHVAVRRAPDSALDFDGLARSVFDDHPLIGSNLGGGLACAVTDFRIHADGFGRILLFDRGLTRRQLGRTLQRLLEIDSYRMMALLALPIARNLSPTLDADEAELVSITAALSDARDEDEHPLLIRLTRLEAAVESRIAAHQFRFSAANAYYGIVRQRIADLREDRIRGLPTFLEFMDRRLAPAMATCQTVTRRQDGLSERAARATQLLATRIDISRERQNQALLASMDRRARLQLRLQETVEGLSVAAVTYYAAGLVGYALKAIKAAGAPIDVELGIGLCVPVIAAFAALGIRRIRRQVHAAGG